MEFHKHEDIIDLAALAVMLCDVCRKAISTIQHSSPGTHAGVRPKSFGYTPRPDTWTGSHHIEDDSLLKSVRSRCYVCYPILQACPKETRELAVYFRTFFEIESSDNLRYSMRFTIETRQVGLSVKTQVIGLHGKFKILPKTDLPRLDFNRHLPTGTFDKECRQQVRNWLQHCCSSHSTCSQSWRTTTAFPMRLVKVAPELGDQLVLEEFAPDDMHPRYATLSHCWDNVSPAQFTCLSTANLDQLKHGFAMPMLSEKFRDAVQIARWLDVDYLWVDALCILQDSQEDWERQAKMMGEIYAGSLCNIAATNAGPEARCFRERPVETVEPFCIPHPASASSESTETHMIAYDDLWCNSLLNATVHTRAWVLQERLLAPRTVHFGKEQIFWECRMSKACEAYPDGIPEQFSNHRTRSWREGEQVFNPRSTMFDKETPEHFSQEILSTVPVHNPAAQTDIPFKDVYGFWARTIEQYMGSDLTFASDKLVAIGGLARKIQETTNEQYLAGLWRNQYLPQSLLWFVPATKRVDGRPSVRHPSIGSHGYRAPSWSWASIDGSITWIWPPACGQVLIEITNAFANPSGDNSVGAVESAALRVRGELIPVRLDIAHQHDDGTLKEDGTYTVKARPDSGKHGIQSCTADSESEAEPLVYIDTRLAPATGIDAYVLPVCTQWQGRTGRIIAAVAGLLLRKIEANGMILYERFGIIGLNDEEACQVRELGQPVSEYPASKGTGALTDLVIV